MEFGNEYSIYFILQIGRGIVLQSNELCEHFVSVKLFY